jgi:hypothetical protein
MKIHPMTAEFIHADGRTDRQTDEQIDRRADRQTGGQTDRRAERQTEGRTYRQTDRNDEANSCFSQFFERAYK